MKNVVIIGAGPTGLFASSLLLSSGYSVDLYDQNSQPGKKLLLAGTSGLNLTNNKDLDTFSQAYGCNQSLMRGLIEEFSPSDLKTWFEELGLETFTGSTGRVFPIDLHAKKLLTLWMERLFSKKGFHFHPYHQLIGLEEGKLCFKVKKELFDVAAPLVLFALGGASYPKTGSNGKWSAFFNELEIQTHPFKPMNCGFECSWSPLFKEKSAGIPLKNIKLSFNKESVRGEAMITSYGLEGGSVYRFSREIRDSIEGEKQAVVLVDLTPDLSEEDLLLRLKNPRGRLNLSEHIRKQLNLSTLKINLFKELTPKEIFKEDNYSLIVKNIKALPLPMLRPRPIEEAISVSGGVTFDQLDDGFMLKKYPGWFTAGEMVDWDAPTGGYLIQGCLSTAYRVVEKIKTL